MADTWTTREGFCADECACRAGMVEVDVGEEEVPDLSDLTTALRESCFQCREGRRRAAVVQGETVVRLDEEAADAAPVALVQEVDRDMVRHPLKVSDGRGEQC